MTTPHDCAPNTARALAELGMNWLFGIDLVGLTEEEAAAKMAEMDVISLARQEQADRLSEMYKRTAGEVPFVPARPRHFRERR